MRWAKGVTRMLSRSYVLSYTAARTRKHLVLLVTMHQLSVLRLAVGYRHSVHTEHTHLSTYRHTRATALTPERLKQHKIKPLTPNDPYRGRTTPLTFKLCILCIYSTNIGTE